MLTVVLAIEDNDCSRSALTWALNNFLDPHKHRLYVLTVVPPTQLPYFSPSLAGWYYFLLILPTSSILLSFLLSSFSRTFTYLFPFSFFLIDGLVTAVYSASMLEEAEKRSIESSSKFLKEVECRIKDKFPSKSLQHELVLGRGSVRDEIVDFTEQVSTDLLILGSHGAGLLKRTFVGSVSDYCIHHCGCPVLVVKPKQQQQDFHSSSSRSPLTKE